MAKKDFWRSVGGGFGRIAIFNPTCCGQPMVAEDEDGRFKCPSCGKVFDAAFVLFPSIAPCTLLAGLPTEG